MKHSTISIRRLTIGLVVLLALVLVMATASGALVLSKNYRTAAGRFESEAREALQQAAITVRNQVRFFTNIMTLVAAHPRLPELLAAGDADGADDWSRHTLAVLPGGVGLALAGPDGTLIGDPAKHHLGTQCRIDLARYARGEPVRLPPVHYDLPGLGHFDLLTPIAAAGGAPAGIVFGSFHIEVLQRLLDEIVAPDRRFLLHDANGYLIGANPPLREIKGLRRFATPVPGTDWQLSMEIPYANALGFYTPLILTDLTAIGVVVLVILATVRRVLGLVRADIKRIHQILLDVNDGVYLPSQAPPAIQETAELLPDIEVLAVQLQERHSLLERQSLTDALTGLHNRRYFDLMLGHDYEQSTRQPPCFLALIDLNDFKAVNDRHGHAAGDTLLRHVASYLLRRVRSSDTVARLGGDEFALLLHNMSAQAIQAWAQQLLTEFDRDIGAHRFGDCGSVPCTLSVGLAPVDAARFDSPKAVLAASDQAMYHAKRMRLGRSHVVFDSELHPAAVAR